MYSFLDAHYAHSPRTLCSQPSSAALPLPLQYFAGASTIPETAFSACLVVPAGSDEDVCGDEGLIRRMMVGRLVGFLL